MKNWIKKNKIKAVAIVLASAMAAGSCAALITTAVTNRKPEFSMTDAKVTLGKYDGMDLVLDASGVPEGELNYWTEHAVSMYNAEHNPDMDEDKKIYLESLTDEQAQLMIDADILNLGETDGYEGLDGFHAYVEAFTRRVLEQDQWNDAYVTLAEELLETSVVELPDGLLEQKTDEQLKELENICSEYYDMTLPEYLESIGTTEAEYRETVKEGLVETTKLELILDAIAEAEGITFDEEGYQEFVKETIMMVECNNEKELYELYGEEHVKETYMNNKVTDWVIEHANITYKGGN